MNQQMNIYKYIRPYINILRQHISAIHVTIFRVSYNKSEISIQTIFQSILQNHSLLYFIFSMESYDLINYVFIFLLNIIFRIIRI